VNRALITSEGSYLHGYAEKGPFSWEVVRWYVCAFAGWC